MQNLLTQNPELQKLDNEVMEQCAKAFANAEQIRDFNQIKVLNAFTKNRIAATHFAGSTGYGYGDSGRDTLDQLFADIVGAEDALCRAQFNSGTHAITVALFGLLRPNDEMVAVAGLPYDTLQPVIGLKNENGSLRNFGVRYRQLELTAAGKPDLPAIAEAAKTARMIYVQRSRGYTFRRALRIADIQSIADTAKTANPNAIVVVDNCYGEFCQTTEPNQAGADIIIGSLLKNPGGAVAETGGYIAGRADLVTLCSERLTAPGVGREIGSWPMGLRNLYLGLYFAPSVTCEAIKSAIYCSALFEKLGYEASPAFDEERNDIITSVKMLRGEKLAAVCRAIQSASPIDSFAVPEAWDMPGYDSKVIMAAGAFTNGSSIELSADGPMRDPYTAYIQGGLSLAASRFAFLRAAEMLGEL